MNSKETKVVDGLVEANQRLEGMLRAGRHPRTERTGSLLKRELCDGDTILDRAGNLSLGRKEGHPESIKLCGCSKGPPSGLARAMRQPIDQCAGWEGP
jgi:hypothetical protein